MEIKNIFKYTFVLVTLVFLISGCTQEDTNQINDDAQDNVDSNTQNEADIDSIIDKQLIEEDNIELGELI